MSGSEVNRVCSFVAATSPFQSVASPNTVIPGKSFFMQSLNASVRSRPLIESRPPSSMTTLPLPPSLVPRNWQAFVP